MGTRCGDGRPLLVAHPLGQPPTVQSTDSMDYHCIETQVLTGTYSCCRMGHQVTSADGQVTKIQCDKDHLRPVLRSMLTKALDTMKRKFASDPEYAYLRGRFHDMFTKSLRSNRAYATFAMLRALTPLIMAESVDEIPASFCCGKPADAISQADFEAYLGEYCLEWPQYLPDGTEGAFIMFPIISGDLPLVRYMLERMEPPMPADYTNPAGTTLVALAARYGHARLLEYPCERVSGEHINFQTPGFGLSALGNAALCGHPRCVEILLQHGANAGVRRKNGKTPLMEAASHGNIECVRLLLAAGADRYITDVDGKTALDLALPMHLQITDILQRAFWSVYV